MPRAHTAALDAKQKNLALRILELRDTLLRQQEEKNEDLEFKKLMLAYFAGLRQLYGIAYKLRKNDPQLFQQVLMTIRSLEGDIESGTNPRPESTNTTDDLSE